MSRILLLFAMNLYLQGSAAQPVAVTLKPSAELAVLEEHVSAEFNAARKAAGQKPLAFRKDIRIRMEACSVAEKGPDDIVAPPNTVRKYWYVTQDPRTLDSAIKELAGGIITYSSLGVGVWYQGNAQYPAGAYWVVVYPEHSAAHETFWGHFYLTDSFAYVTRFDKYWKNRLPPQCRSLK